MFTQEQLEALNQSIRGKRIKIEVLNYNFKIIDTIEGEATDGTIDMDATSDYRMSCNLTMVVDSHYTGIVETKYLIDKGNIIWLDKYIKIYVGIDDLYTGETIWYNMGIYIIDEPSYSYSISQSMLKISGMDLMFNLSDKRRGQLTDYETKIIVYDDQTGMLTNKVSMRETFINILNTYTNITKYYLAPMTGDLEYLPENLTFQAGTTIYDMLSKLLSYLPGWEMFFNLDGVFTVQPIPNGVTDTVYPLDVNNTSMEEISVDFSNVKNLIVVRGRTHDCDYFTQNTTDNPNNVDIEIDSVNGNALKLVVDGTIELNNNITLGFLWLDNTYNPEFRRLILNGTEYQLCDFEKTNQYIPENTFQPGSINVIRFVYKDNFSYPSSQNYWDYLSNDQANAFAVNDTLDNPFYINSELKGENYYGGLTYCADHTNYQIVLNNERTLSQINDGVQITFMPNIWNNTNPTLTIKDGVTGNILLSQKSIVNKSGASLLASQWYGDNTIYIVKYDETNDRFVLQGKLQTFTAYLSGGEYENIYSNSLAQQRAEYELYLHSNLNDQVSITTIPNYCMDVNKKIKYQNFVDAEDTYYLTKTISLPLAATGAAMTIGAMKLYPPKLYITTQLTGCTLEITDEYGNKYSNGDIIKENTILTIYATALEYYINNFTIEINGNSFISGGQYKVTGDVNIVAEAQEMSSGIMVNATGNIDPPFVFYKYDNSETNIYLDDTLVYTSTTSGNNITQRLLMNEGEHYIRVEGGEFSYGNSIYLYCLYTQEENSYISRVDFGYNYSTKITASSFRGANNLAYIYIPSKIDEIGSYAFRGCSFETIDYNAINCIDNTYETRPFYGAGSLDNGCILNILSKTRIVPAWMFAGSNIRNINCEEGVETIKDSAFNTMRLQNAKISSTVKNIFAQSFYNNTSMQSFTIYAKEPPYTNSNTFLNDTNNCPIYVPQESVNVYKTTQYWSAYASRIEAIN